MIFSKRLSSLAVLSAALMYVPALAAQDENYLALGDSVSFGLDVTLLTSVPPPLPSAFTGYPELVAQVERWKVVNASCPGETSGSFLDTSMPDDGCNHPHLQATPPYALPPFKFSIGLKASYLDEQVAFALRELGANKKIQLVTLGIGANDYLLLASQCAIQSANDPAATSACINLGLDAMFKNYDANLTTILQKLRSVYTGKLVLVTYYAPSSDFIPIANRFNKIMKTSGNRFHVTIADGFTAFQLASSLAGGDPCAAGLLTRISATTCDIHPSLAGQAVLAAAVEVAIHSR